MLKYIWLSTLSRKIYVLTIIKKFVWLPILSCIKVTIFNVNLHRRRNVALNIAHLPIEDNHAG